MNHEQLMELDDEAFKRYTDASIEVCFMWKPILALEAIAADVLE